MMIVGGDYSLSIYEGTEQEILPHILVPHPSYNKITNNCDIMLIKVHNTLILFSFFFILFCFIYLNHVASFVSNSSHCLQSLQLRAPFYLNSYVSIALLPRQGTPIAEGRLCRVSGWGYTNPGGGQIPSTLRTVMLPIVSTEKCNSSESFSGNITENMLCAGYSLGGKDACQVRASLLFLNSGYEHGDSFTAPFNSVLFT